MAIWKNEGHAQRVLPPNIMFVHYTNENYGFTANLADGTNTVFAFALPIPATINIFEQTPVWHKLDFFFVSKENPGPVATTEALQVYLSYLDREFAATFENFLADAEDENIKAQFDGPYLFGQVNIKAVRTSNTSAAQDLSNSVENIRYTPPTVLDGSHPLYIQFVSQSSTVTAATGAIADKDFTQFERTCIRGWFTVRRLSPAELLARNTALRFQRLSS